jgi:hypothetical protein
MILVASGYKAFRCLMTKGEKMYPKSKQVMPLARGRNGKCNAKGCMVIGGGT